MIRHFGISATGLKLIAIIAMVIDHVAWQVSLSSTLFLLLHGIGRLTMPIMCFFIAEGFYHTQNRKNYALRLMLFAVISQMPFNYFMTGNPFSMGIGIGSLNVLFCLLLGLCALWVIKSKCKTVIKIALVALCLLGAVFCDWMIFGVLWILVFGLNRGLFKRQVLCFCAVATGVFAYFAANALMGNPWIYAFIQIGVFLALPFLSTYNGKKNSGPTSNWLSSKWAFYIFYPLHLLIIAFLFYGTTL
ncbi:MAG: conjugal transfer protein TraX [Nitrososphaerota archaeon]|nr:conjugal transfer protein TraX [Nitrososphaerota archaeon]